MSGWSSRPMCPFDVESTGVDVETDRIVTACTAAVNAPEPVELRQWVIDPGVEIPAEATAVHGLTTEYVREHGGAPRPALEEMRASLIGAWELGRPVVAFNATFDLTILDRELRRYELPGLDVHGLVVDPLVLDRHVDRFRRGSRRLDAVCEHYGVRLDGAHDSMQDALAAARVAWMILRQHPELDAMDADDLYALQVEAHASWAAQYEDHLRSQGRREAIDRSWPIRRAEVSR